MSNFSSPLLQATCSTTYKSAGILMGATAHRIQLYEAEIGQTGGLSSSDCQVQWDISRFANTNLLTATSVTPQLNDEADSAATITFFQRSSLRADRYHGRCRVELEELGA